MGTWRRGQLPQHVNVRNAWPLLTPLESDAGDFAILRSPTYNEFCQRTSSTLSADEFAQTEEEFMALYRQCIEGKNHPETDWKDWSHRCSLSFEKQHEVTESLQAKNFIPIQYLSDLSEDYIPDIGLFSDEFIWGPFATQHLHPLLRQLAGAICSTLPLLAYKHSAASKAFEQRPKLPPLIHQSLSAHCRQPFMLWKIQGDQVKPLLPIAPQYIPTGSVSLLPNTPFMLGKIIRVQQRWLAHFVFPLQDIGVLEYSLKIRLQVEWMRAQRHCSNLFFEDILRERADILYRYAAEQIFDSTPMEITRCLDYYSSPVQVP